jgi:N,N-dimethylformamidase
MEIVGYSDPMTVAPGEGVRFMVSCEAPSYRFDVVRLHHGDENPAGPGFLETVVPCAEACDRPGRPQPIVAGSYVEVPDAPPLHVTDAMALEVWVCSTTPVKGSVGPLPEGISEEVAAMFLASAGAPEPQGLITRWDAARQLGWGLFLGETGDARFRVGDGDRVTEIATGVALQAGRWYLVSAAVDGGRVHLEQRAAIAWPQDGSAGVEGEVGRLPAAEGVPLVMAGWFDGRRPIGTFNGKLEAPRLHGASPVASSPIAAWDFTRDISGDLVHDTSPNRLHGRAAQLPARGMTGRSWTGEVSDPRLAPEQYGAIHFHDDDLADAGWEPDVEVTLPADLPSGVYAARLRTPSGAEDHVPFFVRPPYGRATADIALLMPTNSYLAYANLAASQRWGTIDGPAPDPLELQLLSLYDVHSDGSGVCYSSRLRPNLKMRPRARLKYPDVPGRFEGIPSYPHQFAADLHLVHWLEQRGHGFDVLTDEILHAEGGALLARYRTVISGTHPEYWSSEMLDALEAYLRAGGRFLYLGGNGLYWVTSFTRDGSSIEVRRRNGTRAWETAPGEDHHASTGELGGLWRTRGRAPQKLVGVGFTAQGYDGAAPYRRTPESHDPALAWIFDGLPEDHELIGDHPSLVFPRGAAGFELDRADVALGTPAHAIVLASSSAQDYTRSYQHAIEEVLTSDSNQGAPGQPLVKADLVLLRYPNGGAVFSTGSIAWCGALAHAGGDNDVSRITDNVLRAFASGAH